MTKNDSHIDFDFSSTNEHVWGNDVFVKNAWGPLNFLVGPNGSGKSFFSEDLNKKLIQAHFRVRYINSERLRGLEKYPSQFISSHNIRNGFYKGHITHYKNEAKNFGYTIDLLYKLLGNIPLRIKIETALAQLFGKEIEIEEEGDLIKIKITSRSLEYSLSEGESHGLKELIIILTALYDEEIDFLILDEPELHIHPQYQQFLMQEIRRYAGNPFADKTKKCIFIVTHSPFFIDLKTISDFENCIFFQSNKIPNFIKEIDPEDVEVVEKILPLLNTHHKQFFFSTNPIFVEGYTDQQIYSIITERRLLSIGATGFSFIDVGGKDHLNTFFKLSRTLQLNSRIIVDLDSIFKGKLRGTIKGDNRCIDYLVSKHGDGDLMNFIGQLERKTLVIKSEIFSEAPPKDPIICDLIDLLRKYDDLTKDGLVKTRYLITVAINRYKELLCEEYPKLKTKFEEINRLLDIVTEALQMTNVFTLGKGELENYYVQEVSIDVSDNNKPILFQKEMSSLLKLNKAQIEYQYKDLISILDLTYQPIGLNTIKVVNRYLKEWINIVQNIVKDLDIKDKQSLEQCPKSKWDKYSQLWSVESFQRNEQDFECLIRLNSMIDPENRLLKFNNNHIPANYVI